MSLKGESKLEYHNLHVFYRCLEKRPSQLFLIASASGFDINQQNKKDIFQIYEKR